MSILICYFYQSNKKKVENFIEQIYDLCSIQREKKRICLFMLLFNGITFLLAWQQELLSNIYTWIEYTSIVCQLLKRFCFSFRQWKWGQSHANDIFVKWIISIATLQYVHTFFGYKLFEAPVRIKCTHKNWHEAVCMSLLRSVPLCMFNVHACRLYFVRRVASITLG